MNYTENQQRTSFSPTFLLLAVLFCTCLITSNLMEIKTFALGPLQLTAGVVVFPISYIISDCIVEIYGFRKARFIIWLGFAMNMLVSLLLQIGIWLPGDAQWQGQEAMEMIFGAVPRIFAASFTAFLCGSMVNAYVMARMKAGHEGTRGFSARAIVSTVWGEGVDSCIFFPIAFGGVAGDRVCVWLYFPGQPEETFDIRGQIAPTDLETAPEKPKQHGLEWNNRQGKNQSARNES